MAKDREQGRWESLAADMLRVEMKRRKVSISALADRLSAGGARITATSIGNKLSRGSFGAAFLLQALVALDCDGPSVGRLFSLMLDGERKD